MHLSCSSGAYRSEATHVLITPATEAQKRNGNRGDGHLDVGTSAFLSLPPSICLFPWEKLNKDSNGAD